jgi:hypothetical protein
MDLHWVVPDNKRRPLVHDSHQAVGRGCFSFLIIRPRLFWWQPVDLDDLLVVGESLCLLFEQTNIDLIK